jgi:methionyl-tRNA synthetase
VYWPAQLIGSGEWFGRLFADKLDKQLTLPYDIPANEFMNLENKKISGSRNWAVWGLDFLSRFDPDTLRYYLTANMPESKDTDWDWDDFVRRNNDELVATWGNLANRVLSFAYRNWQGAVPEPGELQPQDRLILETVTAGFQSVGGHLEAVRLRAALGEALRLSTEVNKYLDKAAPWIVIKQDKDSAARTIYTALRAIDSLKILFAPFVPFSSERLHAFFGYTQPLFGSQFTETQTDALGEHVVLRYRPNFAGNQWLPSQLPPGQLLNEPSPLFRKLDPITAAEERSRLG